MNSSNPEISIIIPIYNVQDYLERCLESVKNQTLQNWEAICINDGSTDNSLQILQQFAEQDKRFNVISQKNCGLSPTRNTGLNLATGKYIMYLDSDDFIHPQCMELALKAITDTGSDICQFNFISVKADEKISFNHYGTLPKIEKTSEMLLKTISNKVKKSVVVWDKIYKADIAKKIKFKNVNSGEDVLYTFEILDFVKSYCRMPLNLIYYVQRPSSITHKLNSAKKYDKHILFINEYVKIINSLALKHNKRPELVKKLRKYISERLFRAYILNTFKYKMDKQKIETQFAQLENMVRTGDCNISLLRLRFKIFFYLVQHKYYKLASLLA